MTAKEIIKITVSCVGIALAAILCIKLQELCSTATKTLTHASEILDAVHDSRLMDILKKLKSTGEISK